MMFHYVHVQVPVVVASVTSYAINEFNIGGTMNGWKKLTQIFVISIKSVKYQYFTKVQTGQIWAENICHHGK